MRLLPLLACAALGAALGSAGVSGCTADGAGGSAADGQTDGHARTLERDFRRAAQDVLPPLVRRLHGTLTAMPAYFVGCQVSGQWRYVAHGEIHDPAGDLHAISATTRDVLESQGFETSSDRYGVHGTRGAVEVSVSRAVLAQTREISFLRVDLVRAGQECEDYSDSDEQYAKRASRVDYAGLVD